MSPAVTTDAGHPASAPTLTAGGSGETPTGSTPADTGNPAAVYASPQGSDKAAGTKRAPLATLSAAIAMASAKGLSEIILEDGVYYQSRPVFITPASSGLYIHADSGAHPVISGSRVLTGLNWQTYKGNIVMTNVGGATFDQLFANDGQQVLARYPNYQAAAPGVVFNGSTSQSAIQARAAKWAPSAQGYGYLHSMLNAKWADQHQIVYGVGSNGRLSMSAPVGNNRLSQGTDTSIEYVEGVLDELDAPGEWYLDTTKGVLYFYPPTGMNVSKARFEGTTTESLIRLVGTEQNPVQNVRIDGLVFTKGNYTFMKTTEPLLRSDWTIYRNGAVFLEGTKDVKITNNVFHDLGNNAIFVSGYNRSVTIDTNEIYNIGASAIAFVGRQDAVRAIANSSAPAPSNYSTAPNYANLDMTPGPKTNNYPSDSIATDNLIHDIGLKEKQVAGVEISMASKITVDHNSIYNTPRAGINIGDGTWGGHVIQYNDVFNTVLETGDHGAFNAWGRDRYWSPNLNDMRAEMQSHPTIWNLDAVDTTVIQFNRFRCDRGWDIDFDDGTSNYLVQNNVLLGTTQSQANNDLSGGLKFREGFNRTGKNNIILNRPFYPQVWFANSGDVFTNNITMGAHNPAILSYFGKLVDQNLFMTAADLKASQNLDPGAWEIHSAVGNPKFTDPENGNYNVPSDSPAVTQIGFVGFDTTRFGVTNAALKAKAVTPAFPVLDYSGTATQTSDRTTLAIGATVESVTTVAQQSSLGLPTVSGVQVVSVQAGSLSASSGLQANDAIVGAGTTTIATVADLSSAINQANGASLALRIYRNQAPMTITLKTK
uniref:right-handed parallel beta-helix repeat-containing protein n=1 Tax=Burkholderia arboris TaxID=488730 RepID=UPI003BEF402A